MSKSKTNDSVRQFAQVLVDNVRRTHGFIVPEERVIEILIGVWAAVPVEANERLAKDLAWAVIEPLSWTPPRPSKRKSKA